MSRREQILDSATSVFAAEGFAGARITKLAKAAGVSQALIYKLFGSKSGLFDAVIERKLAQVAESGVFTVAPSDPRDDFGFFLELGRSMFAHIEADPDFFKLFLHSDLQRGAFAAAFREQMGEPFQEHLASYVRLRVREGGFRHTDPRLAAMGYLTLMAYSAIQLFVSVVDIGGKSPDDCLRGLTEVYVAGLRSGGS